MTEALLGAIVEGVVSKVISVAAEQITLAWGFKDELKKLGDLLKMIQAFLHDADKKQKHNSVKCWLEGLKDVAYQADDVLDEFDYEIHRRKVEIGNQMRRKVCNFISPSNPIIFRLKMANKIKGILKSLDDLNKRAMQFGLQIGVIDQINPSFGGWNGETVPFQDVSEIVGRKNDVSKVINLVINQNDDEQVVSVVPIVGMAGIGKTALAKLVYNDADEQKHFDIKFWVCVSDNFDVKRILKEMLDHFNDQHILISDSPAVIVEKLKKKLEQLKKEKEEKKEGRKEHVRYLLVLDDVWNVDTWKQIEPCLKGINQTKGNKIIVTTRKEDVAKKLQPNSHKRHGPKKLLDDECWSIIQQEAIIRSSPMPQQLVSIGKGIAEQCKGVPLLARVIGGILRSIEPSPDAWMEIKGSDAWHSDSVDGSDFVEKVLKLSFDHLSSPSLKKCFAYCALFPKDFCFEKEQLIQLWTAEGFLGTSSATMDIGNNYLNTLLSNSLFQDVDKDACGNVISCKMHDMVHDLALFVSKFETSIFNENSTYPANGVSHIRHLKISLNRDSLSNVLTNVAPRLHSLFSEIDVFKVLSLTFKKLRVLNFRGANDDILELPNSLGELKRMRYLDISETSITALPLSITKLYKLQTLRFMDCKELTFPNGLRKLISLMHIHFDDESNQPVELRDLTSLQTLPMFFVGDLMEHRIDTLKCLNQLGGELCINKLERVKDKKEAMEAGLHEKSRLNKLIFVWNESCGKDEEVIENLRPHLHLQSLSVRGYVGANFPFWMRLLDNLIELELIDCIKCKSLPSLGQLQKLKYLTLREMKKVECMGNEFYGNARNHGSNAEITVFPTLKRLTISGMENLKEWTTTMAATIMFPLLKELKISYCDLLESVPLVRQLKHLEVLNIEYCSNLSNTDGLSTSTCLRELPIGGCSNLSSIPDLEGFSSL